MSQLSQTENDATLLASKFINNYPYGDDPDFPFGDMRKIVRKDVDQFVAIVKALLSLGDTYKTKGQNRKVIVILTALCANLKEQDDLDAKLSEFMVSIPADIKTEIHKKLSTVFKSEAAKDLITSKWIRCRASTFEVI